MKIISFAAIKGGVGKTTLAFNFGEWLALHDQKVLFIDLDHQCNLTQTYNIYQDQQTVANIFKGKGDVEIIPVKDKVHVLPGYMQLDSVEKDLENKVNKDMLLYMWLEDHYEDKELGQYDVVIIDCHPDFSTATRNAIAVSHTIISPIIPSEHGYNAKFNLEDRLEAYRQEVVDYRTRESYITSQLYFLPNMIKHNTQSSKKLLEVLNSSDDQQLIKREGQVVYVPEKELFNKSTLEHQSVFEMKPQMSNLSQHRHFFDDLEETFTRIFDIM
ncbi:Chromosome (plasmid) partitioning protein ParA / Sporulation initiation inhibitor protein Soj [Streptococcus sp. DD10]|uniref:ParA family protein n=1 Tax=Streptococcus sp. DD10 TaxID=1777878 RepID=UPI000798E05F|nr:AAA family ATPase [Streptococcus sp. DD10]KXT75167.1 Chromosome (plasmid) partitioning protein ParA / Sporulation initiation inhibitor protein Soj [Streptococcus sp. DD10]